MLWGIGDTRRFTDPEACNETSRTVVVIGNETRCEAPVATRNAVRLVTIEVARGSE